MDHIKKENRIAAWLADHREDVIRTADYIFQHPETAYKEELSSACLAAFWRKMVSRWRRRQRG